MRQRLDVIDRWIEKQKEGGQIVRQMKFRWIDRYIEYVIDFRFPFWIEWFYKIPEDYWIQIFFNIKHDESQVLSKILERYTLEPIFRSFKKKQREKVEWEPNTLSQK